jgi:hypothetical protein
MLRTSDRFFAKVLKTEGCWLWQGARDRQGYGIFRFPHGNKKAHRVSWSLAYGKDVPVGVLICHHCDNPPCVRPEHLFTGTVRDNYVDSRVKGRARAPMGEEQHSAKLTPADVVAMRRLAADGATHSDLASQFGVCRSSVGNTVNKLTWRHI